MGSEQALAGTSHPVFFKGLLAAGVYSAPNRQPTGLATKTKTNPELGDLKKL